MLDRVPSFLRDFYENTFRLADEAYFDGRVEATTKSRQTHWRRWCCYVAPLGVDPHLQGTTFKEGIRTLTGFAEHLQDSQPSSEKDTSIANKAKSELQQSVALLRPLERRVPWTAE